MSDNLPRRDFLKTVPLAAYALAAANDAETASQVNAGTYIQNLADYHNIIYFRDSDALYVNLYVPSNVTWTRPSGDITIVQDTTYPDGDTTTLTIGTRAPAPFALRLRVPSWSRGMSVTINGSDERVNVAPGTWATITRTWSDRDRVEIRIPLTLRMEAVDRQHRGGRPRSSRVRARGCVSRSELPAADAR